MVVISIVVAMWCLVWNAFSTTIEIIISIVVATMLCNYFRDDWVHLLKKGCSQWKIQTNARTWILDKLIYNCTINIYVKKLMCIYININLFAIIGKLFDLPDLHDWFHPLSSSWINAENQCAEISVFAVWRAPHIVAKCN